MVPQPNKKNICAIIVSHNPGEEFLSNIQSTSSQVDKIVVVNNGSEKLTPDFFQKTKVEKGVYLINNSDNLGQGKALNQGTGWAISQGYEWVLLLDQNSIPEPLMVEELIKAYQACPYREKLGIIASNCTYRNIGEIKYTKECHGKSHFERDVVMMSGTLLSSATPATRS